MVMKFHREIDTDATSDFLRQSKSLKLILSQLHCEEYILYYCDFQCLERLEEETVFLSRVDQRRQERSPFYPDQ